MYVVSRFNPRGFGRRLLVGALLAIALFFNSVGTLLAGTTGEITGTITDASTKAPLPGVRVSAVSPTGQYSTKTDAKGFFSFTGVTPDTYTVSFELTGYQPSSTTGVNVFADQVATVSVPLAKSLKTIGSVTARSPGGAYQPTQTQDTYTVTSQQIATQLGKADATSETNLLVTLPGVTKDSSGYPVLRGGRENEEGYQFEGIDYTDALTSQFINSLALNSGVAQLQLIPGAGDASNGNSGTGVINLVAKRGANPAFGSIDLEALTQPYAHQLGLEYGFATPNNRLSEYITFLGTRTTSQYGEYGSVAKTLGTGVFYAPRRYFASGDIVNNTVFKFGKDNQQSLQFFYENQRNDFYGNYGGFGGMNYTQGDPYYSNFLPGYTGGLIAGPFGLTSQQVGQLTHLLPGQPAPVLNTADPNCNPANVPTNYGDTCYSDPLDRGNSSFQPNDVMKFQYANNIDASTYVTIKAYRTNSVTTFDNPFDEGSLIEASYYLKQGGQRSGLALDSTKQLNTQNLLQFGAKYEFLKPTYDWIDPVDGVLATTPFFSDGYDAAAFISPNSPNCPLAAFGVPTGCGYLFKNWSATGGPNWASSGPGPIPYNAEQVVATRHDASLYALDQISPSDKLKINAGIRVDTANYALPPLTGCNPTSGTENTTDPTSWYNIGSECQYAPTGYHKDANGDPYPYTTLDTAKTHPVVPEPRLAFSYQVTKNDAFRASFARSVEFAPIADIDDVIPTGIYSAFANIPSYNYFSGGQSVTCGIFYNALCHNYAEQLRWDNQNFIEGVPVQPVLPETFTNYDVSFSHQFGQGVSAKLTPFYRRGYNQVADAQLPLINPVTGKPEVDSSGGYIFGPSQVTNLGVSKTTGVEFYLTKEAKYGFSGSFSATYINEFSNVIPTSPDEDFFPSIPAQSLILGNLYRVGFLSPFQSTLAFQYKSRGGWRINPVISYDRGYPIGAGTLTPFVLNGVAVNVPNTNYTSVYGSTNAYGYLDPVNPGTVIHPNIYGTRGTPEGASAGGMLSSAQLNTNVSIEFSPPGSHSTFGLLVTNLFNQLYGTPSYNGRWQPVATGIGGPETGSSQVYYDYPEIGSQSTYGANRFGYNPYLLSPSNTPIEFRLYYQLAL